MELTAKEIALKIAEILNEKKAEDIKVLEVSALTSIGDYFILCIGGSSTHIKALCDEVKEKMRDAGVLPLHNEGYNSANWLLMDYGSVVVHIFDREAAKFYDLERLWVDAPQLSLEHLN